MQNSHNCQLISKNGPNFFWPIVGQVVKGLIPGLAVLPSNAPDNQTPPWVSTLPSDKSLSSHSYSEDTLSYTAANIKGYLP